MGRRGRVASMTTYASKTTNSAMVSFLNQTGTPVLTIGVVDGSGNIVTPAASYAEGTTISIGGKLMGYTASQPTPVPIYNITTPPSVLISVQKLAADGQPASGWSTVGTVPVGADGKYSLGVILGEGGTFQFKGYWYAAYGGFPP